MKKIIFACLLFYFQGYAQRSCKNKAQVDDPKLRGEYRGQCQDGEAHGKGIAKGTYSYKGDFQRGKKHGNGVYKTTNYAYKGQFKLDLFSGTGELKYFDPKDYKYFYTGTWIKGQKDGQGELTTNDYKYTGGWQEDLKHGKGTITFKDRSRYEGEWKADLKHGKGKFYYADAQKSVYDGFWKEDKRWGRGKYSNKNYTYDGLWEADKRAQQGKMIRINRKITEKYEGDWEADLFHGRGKFEYIYKRPNHKKSYIYEGDFENGIKTNQGKVTFGKSGDTYEGEWQDGKPAVYGTYVFAKTQNYYEGEWAAGQRHGLGIRYYKKGDIKTKAGEWYQDKIVEEKDFNEVRQYLDRKYTKFIKDTKPAKLEIVDKIIQIEPAETLQPDKIYELIFNLRNTGSGTAQAVKLKISQKDFKTGFEYNDKVLGSIKADETITVSLPIRTTQDLRAGTVTFILEALEKRGYNAIPIEISYNTAGYNLPALALKEPIFERAKNVHTLELELLNKGRGAAQDITIEMVFPQTVDIIGQTSQKVIRHFENLESNGSKVLEAIKFKINPRDLTAGFEVEVKTKAANFTEFTKRFFHQEEEMGGTVQPGGGFSNPNNIALTSDVDKNLPKTTLKRPNAIAIIMGVSNYKNARNVDYALHDAKAMQKYVIEVLGFKSENVKVYLDPSLGDFIGLLGGANQNNLGRLGSLIDENTELFFFYAGHGAPIIKKKTTFLLPTDATGDNLEATAYPLPKLYEKFDQLNPAKLTVIIDACFSGAQTDFYKGTSIQFNTADLPENASNIFDKPNYILLTAADRNQYANWYSVQKHSLFTYYLLKGLQTKTSTPAAKSLSYQDLYNYTKTKVEQFSKKLGTLKNQTPQIYGSAHNNIFVEYNKR